jgi:hypothetical protein
MKPSFNAIFGIFMVVFYFVFSGMLAFTGIFNAIIPKKTAYILSAIFFLYGIFRAYRYYRTSRNKQ